MICTFFPCIYPILPASPASFSIQCWPVYISQHYWKTFPDFHTSLHQKKKYLQTSRHIDVFGNNPLKFDAGWEFSGNPRCFDIWGGWESVRNPGEAINCSRPKFIKSISEQEGFSSKFLWLF